MAIDKSTPSEAGSGGKRGHSNMHYWGTNDEAKDNARKKRRLDSKVEIQNQMDDRREDVEPLNDFDPYEAIQELWKDPKINDLNLKIRLKAIQKYPQWKQDTYFVLVAEGLIANGGTPALFYNHGCLAPYVAQAYQKIGAIDHAKWIQDLALRFGDPYPLDLDSINDLLDDVPDQLWDESSEFFINKVNSSKIDALLFQLYQDAHAC